MNFRILKSKLNVNQLKRFKKQIETFWGTCDYTKCQGNNYHKRYEKYRIIKGPRLIICTWLIWWWVELRLAKPVDSQKELRSENWQKYRNERYSSSYIKVFISKFSPIHSKCCLNTIRIIFLWAISYGTLSMKNSDLKCIWT